MNVLLIKMSSLGDIIHTLPALTDAARMRPELRFDWVVEESFAEIPGWHSQVDRVIPIALRRWRKKPWKLWRGQEWHAFREALQAREYDYVLDAQGLLKSAWIAWQAKGPRYGLNRDSAREPFAAHFYQHRLHVPRGEHAVIRVRQLFAQTFDYALPETLDYGLSSEDHSAEETTPRLLFFHGTTWRSKHWPEPYWAELALLAAQAGYVVRLPWGTPAEQERAARLAAQHPNIQQLPSTCLGDIVNELRHARAAVGVDTGLVHLAAALNVPSLSLYGATHPGLTGSFGAGQVHLRANFPCAPCLKRICDYHGPGQQQPACFGTLPPQLVWARLQDLISNL